jgi:Cof subfamily protein (haloacid dehalogenase superfamily)
MIEVIAVDLDGTLMTSKHHISPRTAEALRKAMAMGLKVVIATGKTRVSAEPTIQQLALETPGVFLQGLVIYNADGSLHSEITLDEAVVDQMVSIADAEQFALVAYCGHRLLTAERNANTDRLIPYHEPTPEAVGSLRNVFGHVSINKLLFIDTAERIRPLRARLEAELHGAATVVQALPDMLEILPLGASKGGGVKRLLDALGIDPANMIAFGDAENDIEMLQMAGIGVAMGNASEIAKRAADIITSSNDEDGIADALEKFVFVERSAH